MDDQTPGFPKDVRVVPRSQAEIEAEKYSAARDQAVRAIVEASNLPDGGAYGYEKMLERLFQTFESDHGAVRAIDTILDALKPLVRRHYDLDKLRTKFDKIVDEVEASK